jgi:superfamily I DNA/RNA helicase
MGDLDAIYDIDHRTAAFERHEKGVLVCLAGPGTGKTFSLLARIQALANRRYDQESICYLTFIREVASAFADDYIERFGEDAYAASPPRISTLHSFACRVIRNQGFRINYDGELFFLNLADSDTAGETFLGDLLPAVSRDGCRTVGQLRFVVETIKRSWQDGIDPATAPEPASLVVRQLMEACLRFRLMDWDQTIPVAGALLRESDELPEWLSKIKHYLVDEYQDFNRAEQYLISYLSGAADSMVVVGDDEQSLYSGRGGSPDGIRTLYAAGEHNHVSLVKCFRCKGNIVAVANAFQDHMSTAPRPMTAAAGGGQVHCYRFKSSKAEVSFLAEYLNARAAELPVASKPNDGTVCLFPSKRILNAYFEMLSPLVKCARRGRETSRDRLWLERVLLLLVHRRQRFIERLLLDAYKAVKPRYRALIVRRVLEQDVSPAEACSALVGENAFAGEALAASQSFVDLCAALAGRDLPLLSQLVSATLRIDPPVMLAELEKLMDADASERDNLVAVTCDALFPATAPPPPDPRVVTFLTMHGSKGLTRRTVVLPGMEEACLPDGGDPAGLPEKQRLFFVAVSRATGNLLVTLPHNRGGTDSLNFPMPGRGDPSTFIAGAGLAAQYHT